MKKLHELGKGKSAQIVGFADNPTKCHSTRFGLCEGQIIKCLANIGPVIVGKNQQTIAVGKNLSKNIEIKQV